MFCVVQSRIAELAGPAGLAAAKVVVVGAAFALVTASVRSRAGAGVTSFVVVVATLAASQRFFVRPELATYLFIALFCFVLERDRHAQTRTLWLLPVLQVVWVNTHTLFVFGPLLVGLAACIGRARFRRVAPVATATAVACLVNPWALRGALFPWQLFTQIRGDSAFNLVIEEFRAPLIVGASQTPVRCWLVLAGVALVSAILNRARLDPFWTVLACAQLYLSFLAIRNLPLFALAAIPFILSNLDRAPAWERLRTRLPADAVFAAATLVLCGYFGWAIVTDRLAVRQGDTNQFGIGFATSRYPVGAADFLEQSGTEGRVLSTMREASYLIDRGRAAFFDPRLEVYGEELLRRYLAVQSDPRAFADVVREYDVRVVVAETGSNLTRIAWRSPRWGLVFFDEVAAVFFRRDDLGAAEPLETPDRIVRQAMQAREGLPRPGKGPLGRAVAPDPYLALADLLLIAGLPDPAEDFVREARSIRPDAHDLALRSATVAELRGDWVGMREAAQEGLGRTPEDPRLVHKLATALYREGRFAEAIPRLVESVEARPTRASARAMLGGALAAEGRLAEAEVELREAVALEPRPDYLANLARVHARLGRIDEAIAGLERALEAAPTNERIRRDLAILRQGAT